MNKSDLKNFAINARLELLRRVSDRAALYGINEKSCASKTMDSKSIHKLDGTVMTAAEIEQRDALLARVRQLGYRPAMEAAAYIWFNRFIAVKYMQEHGLLPVSQRVFPDASGAQPQILREAQDVYLPGVNMETVLSMLDANRTDELYKYLLIALCNALSNTLPGMFESVSSADELLFPDALLKPDSVLGEMAKLDADSWKEIQVIGWLYQYYNTQLKDETFELLKKNVKITKDHIGAATQLFTPEWIVDYMVENSLGRLWLEGHPDESLREKWRYYMKEAEQTPEVAAKLAEIRAPYASIQPEQLTVLDPCMGSGHILVYAFDVLMGIYRSVGYTDRDAVMSIVKNNLYGLDIDDRAAQLAYFAVMMKACEYDCRFLRRGVQPHVYSVQESTPLDAQTLQMLGAEKSLAERLMRDFVDAKEYGSLTSVSLTMNELERLSNALSALEVGAQDSLVAMADHSRLALRLCPLVNQARLLVRQYDIVITNPPYMGSSGMDDKLSRFVKENYPDSKSDLFAAFIERCGELLNINGYQAMITQHAWMFLSSFEKLRQKLQACEMISMAHLGPRAFEEIGGEVVQTTAFVMQKKHVPGYKGSYARLIEPTTQDGKEEMYLSGANRYTAQQDNFKKIPGAPIAYWVSERFISNFSKGSVSDRLFSGGRNKTHNNEKYTRMWWEIEDRDRWQLYAKGGEFRRWYGNVDTVVDWSDEAKTEYDSHGGLYKQEYSYKEGICWTLITSAKTAFRIKESPVHYDSGAPTIFNNEYRIDYAVLGFLNSNVATDYLELLNPTINMGNTYVLSLPLLKEVDNTQISVIVTECVGLSRKDWDCLETSCDFGKHRMI